MNDKEALTFIAGKDYVALAKGEVVHAELIADIHGEKYGNDILIQGNRQSLISDIESAGGVVGKVGVLQGRMWIMSKFISFWQTKNVVHKHKRSMGYIFKAAGPNPKEFEFEFEADESSAIDPDRHTKSVGAQYLPKDNPKMRTPEEERFEKMLRLKRRRKN